MRSWLTLLVLMGCKGSGEVWEETTRPYDPDCATCTTVIDQAEIGHLGTITIQVQEGVDDAQAQWDGCLYDWIVCVDKGRDFDTCVEEAACPKACAKAYRKELPKDPTAAQRADAFEAVFLAPNGLCAPPHAKAGH